MTKRILGVLLIALALVLTLASCSLLGGGELDITIEDGYVVINGVKTDYQVLTEEDLVREDEVKVGADGYIVVNGKKTEYKADTADVITVENGYLVVNGVKTQHEVKNKNHSFGDWRLYNVGETDCENKLYYRTCSDCASIEWREGKHEDHSFVTVTTEATCQAGGYDTNTCQTCGKVEITNETAVADHALGAFLSDKDGHWQECENCDYTSDRFVHTIQNDACAVCGRAIMLIDGFWAELSEDGTYLVIVGHVGSVDELVIPQSYKGLPVKAIGDEAFLGFLNVTSIVIPSGVTTIGDLAFSGCINLTNIVLPDGVTTIGECAFNGCFRLTSIVLPEGLTVIKECAFWGCDGLTSIVIPASVTSISADAFSWCTGLTDVYYAGSEGEWQAIAADVTEAWLTNATIHYNYVLTE